MSKLYVFGIGGTGSRVIKSLTMLLASGIKLGDDIDKVVPVIIDPDKSNGDLTRTVSILKNYKSIKDQFSCKSEFGSGFFSTDIDCNSSYILNVANTSNKSFADYIKYQNLDQKNQALISLLFSDKNLDSSMEVGFKGNPNMGSVVLNNFRNDKSTGSLSDVLSGFNKGDKIFIISSIFGGTGAAGFPLLLKTIREAGVDDFNSHALLRKSTIGAITVLPYFGVKNDPDSEIKMETFISKAKSALTYYQDNINLDYMYYISDDIKSQYDNVEGDKNQKNSAHFIELAASLAIVNFAQNSSSFEEDVRTNCEYKEFGVKKCNDPMSFSDLEYSTQKIIQKNITQLFFLSQHFLHQLPSQFDQAWAKEKMITKSILTERFFKDLKSFIDFYMEWLNEMGKNKRAFKPFNLENASLNILEAIVGIDPQKKNLLARVLGKDNNGFSAIDNELATVSNKTNSTYTKEDYFMGIFYKATENVIKNKFNDF